MFADGLLICPECNNHLRTNVESVRCEADGCEFAAAVVNRVPLLIDVKHTPQYEGLIGRSFVSPKMYDKIINIKWSIMGLLRVRDAFLGIQHLTEGATVLEVGCGPNLLLPSSEYDYRHCKRVVGLDYSSEFVLAAREKHQESMIDFVQASAERLPFPDNSFDVVIAAFTIHHVVASPQVVMRELVRVARKYIVIFDHVKSDRYMTQRIQNFYWNYVDGGHHYLTSREWDELVHPFQIRQSLRTGALGSHVIKMLLEIN